MSDDLLPCPFCGSDGEYNHIGQGHYDVKCSNPSCGAYVGGNCKVAAINQWNTRHTPTPQGDAAEAINFIKDYVGFTKEWEGSEFDEALKTLTAPAPQGDAVMALERIANLRNESAGVHGFHKYGDLEDWEYFEIDQDLETIRNALTQTKPVDGGSWKDKMVNYAREDKLRHALKNALEQLAMTRRDLEAKLFDKETVSAIVSNHKDMEDEYEDLCYINDPVFDKLL